MVAFEDYFSDISIIRELCKARVGVAEQRHEALFFHNINEKRPSAEQVPLPSSWQGIPINIFPPRKLWNRYRPKDRGGSSRDINLETLVRAARYLSVEQADAEWAKLLHATVAMIRYRALSEEPFAFSPPTIMPEVKDRKQRTYRPLASLSLADRIIDCLAARYFREALNVALLDSCLAFRPRSDGRHVGLDIILRERECHTETGLFVAECDIKGFYDCVSHDVARRALDDLTADATRMVPSLTIHARAREISRNSQ